MDDFAKDCVGPRFRYSAINRIVNTLGDMQSGATLGLLHGQSACHNSPRRPGELRVPNSIISTTEKFPFWEVAHSNLDQTVKPAKHHSRHSPPLRFTILYKIRRTVIVCVPVKPELLVHQEAPVLPEHKEEMLVSNEKMDYELKTPSYYPDLRLSLVAGLLKQ